MKRRYSTAEVAKAIGVSKNTLLRWLYAGALPEPRREPFGGIDTRMWTDGDVKRAKAYKERNYRKRS